MRERVHAHAGLWSGLLRMMPSESASVIGRSMKIKGELSGSGDLLIDGEVEGTIKLSEARLTVRPDGRVRAALEVPDVVVLGLVEGEVRATGRLELRSGSTMLGDLFAARLSIEDGATVLGGVDPTKASEPLSESRPAAAHGQA